MQQKEQRAVVDARQARPEAASEAQVIVLGLHDVQLLLPFHAERRVGQHVVKLGVGKAIARLAVAQRVAEYDVRGVRLSALDHDVGAANRERFVVVLLTVHLEPRAAGELLDIFLCEREHAASAATGVVQGAHDTRCGQRGVVRLKQHMHHEANHLTRREVISRFFVRLLVELAHQLFKHIAHHVVGHTVRVQVNVGAGERLNHFEQQIGAVKFFDFFLELEVIENVARLLTETLQVVRQIAGELVRVAEHRAEGVFAGVEKRHLELLLHDAPDGVGIVLLRLQPFVFVNHARLGVFQHAIKAAQHDQRNHHAPILRRTISAAQQVGNTPDEIDEFLLFGDDVH